MIELIAPEYYYKLGGQRKIGPLISLSVRLYQYDMILQMTHPFSYFAASYTDGSLENEQQGEFPNVLTSSGGALIGGSCTGLVFLLVVLYLLYKLFKPDNRINDICARCGRIRSDSPRQCDGCINPATVLEVCTCVLS